MMSAAQLAELMGREMALLGSLAQLLEQEANALKTRDAAAVEAGAIEKRTLIEALESLAGERSRLLGASGLSPDGKGFESYLATLTGKEGDALRAQWGAVKETLTTCQKQNQMNGMLLDASMRSTQQALSILLGHAREPGTYNSQGTVPANLGTRSVAKA